VVAFHLADKRARLTIVQSDQPDVNLVSAASDAEDLCHIAARTLLGLSAKGRLSVRERSLARFCPPPPNRPPSLCACAPW